MKHSPFLNALTASVYIGLIVVFLHFIESIRHDTPDTVFDGLAFISLFTFSAAVMAFLFFYQPISLLIENKKEEAFTYFIKTIGIFGLITVVLMSMAVLQ